jgi:hypothetical protein
LRRRQRLVTDMVTGLDLCPVSSTRQWNVRAPACLCQANIGNADSGCDLGHRSRPHELVEIFTFQIVRMTPRAEGCQGRQIRLDSLQLDILTRCRRSIHRAITLARQFSRVVDFVRNALSCRAKDADSQPGKVMFVNAFDRVPDQQIQDDWVNPELSPDALKQPTKIMRRNAGSLTTWCLASPKIRINGFRSWLSPTFSSRSALFGSINARA